MSEDDEKKESSIPYDNFILSSHPNTIPQKIHIIKLFFSIGSGK